MLPSPVGRMAKPISKLLFPKRAKIDSGAPHPFPALSARERDAGW